MPSLKMELAEPVFQTTCRVIYGDTDAGGVVYNANYLRYFEVGRTELMRTWAIPYSAIETRGLVLPLTESYVRYRAPARYDDLLTVSLCLAELRHVSCRFHYRITRRLEEGGDQVLATGFTVHACVDRQGHLVPLPEDLIELLRPQVIQAEKRALLREKA